jgi:hypothetical protein
VKFVRALSIGLSLALTCPAAASDFSQLAEPAFGRMMLLSADRHKEANCAALAFLPFWKPEVIEFMEAGADEEAESIGEDAAPAVPQITFEKLLTEPQAERLKAAVLLRLQSDIGDEKWATEAFEHAHNRMAPSWDYSQENIERTGRYREELKPECQSIFDAVVADQLEGQLSPASAEPIALPDVDTCLAYDLMARKSDSYDQLSYLHEDGPYDLYTEIVGRKGPKRRAKEKEIAALADTIKDVSPDVASSRLIACMPVFFAQFAEAS